MLIVFGAVPALQRNQRNTQRNSDVSILQGALNNILANKNGKLPTTKAELDTALEDVDFSFYTEGTKLGAATSSDDELKIGIVERKKSGNPPALTHPAAVEAANLEDSIEDVVNIITNAS